MAKTKFTPKEFVAFAAKRQWSLIAIKKEVPEGSGRWLFIGFEYSKRSSKRREKYMFNHPIPCDPPTKEIHHAALIDTPVLTETADTSGTQPADGPAPGGAASPATDEKRAVDPAVELGAQGRA